MPSTEKLPIGLVIVIFPALFVVVVLMRFGVPDAPMEKVLPESRTSPPPVLITPKVNPDIPPLPSLSLSAMKETLIESVVVGLLS